MRADSPQDIVDAVAGDKGHKDVLQEKERSCRERFPPSSSSPQAGNWQRHPTLESPLLQEPQSPQASPCGVSLLLFLQPAKTWTRFFWGQFRSAAVPMRASHTQPRGMCQQMGPGATKNVPTDQHEATWGSAHLAEPMRCAEQPCFECPNPALSHPMLKSHRNNPLPKSHRNNHLPERRQEHTATSSTWEGEDSDAPSRTTSTPCGSQYLTRFKGWKFIPLTKFYTSSS